MSEPYWVPLSGGPIYLPNPSARVYRTTAQAILVGGDAIAFDAERYDTDGIHDNVTNPSRLTCRTAGKYLIWAHVELANNATGTIRQLRLRLNGSTLIAVVNGPNSTLSFQEMVSTVWDMAVGDYVEVYIYHDATAPLNVGSSPPWSPEFGMARLDAALPTTLPPVAGGELAYGEITAGVSVTATAEASANTIITAPVVTLDGATPVLVEFNSHAVLPTPAAAAQLHIWLFQDGISLGRLAYITNPAAASLAFPVRLARRLTPAAGSRTFSVRATVSTGTGTVGAGAGVAGGDGPAFIRITRA